jgi:hypothetical protein
MRKKRTVNRLHLWEVETQISSENDQKLWITTAAQNAELAARKTRQFERATHGRGTVTKILVIKYSGTLDA